MIEQALIIRELNEMENSGRKEAGEFSRLPFLYPFSSQALSLSPEALSYSLLKAAG
jgi:hypothetical protein